MKMFLANLEMFNKNLSTARKLKHKISSIPAGLSDAAVSAPPGFNVCAHLFAEASRVVCQTVRRPKRTCVRSHTHAQPTVSSCQDGFCVQASRWLMLPLLFSPLFALLLSHHHPLFSSHPESSVKSLAFVKEKKKDLLLYMR